MTYSSYRVRVPGKLVIAGEYAVLEPNQQAIVMAVDRYMSAYIEPSSKNQLSIPQYGLEDIGWEVHDKRVQFSIEDSRHQFVQNAIHIASQFVSEQAGVLPPFHLSIRSELADPMTDKKYGFGSSAAIVVAVISAILTLHEEHGGDHSTLEQLFKLAAIAHVKTQKSGSGIDIAAAVFGGWVCYSAFDAEWLLAELTKKTKLSELVDKNWPNLLIQPLNPLCQPKLCVGWTAEEASTSSMINEIARVKDQNPAAYSHFLKESASAVNQLMNSLESGDVKGAMLSLHENRLALKGLSDATGVAIETPKLRKLCKAAERYGSGKSSGAGGGDCGIAFVEAEHQVEKLHRAWRGTGIKPLHLGTSKTGALVTEYNCNISLKEYLSMV